jgi:hypothetical protein
VHTDSLTVYETKLEVTKTEDGGEIRKPFIEATAVVEQRVSHFLMGMAIWGTMTGPLLTVLHTMPAAVFAGVFCRASGVIRRRDWPAVVSCRLVRKEVVWLRLDKWKRR